MNVVTINFLSNLKFISIGFGLNNYTCYKGRVMLSIYLIYFHLEIILFRNNK